MREDLGRPDRRGGGERHGPDPIYAPDGNGQLEKGFAW